MSNTITPLRPGRPGDPPAGMRLSQAAAMCVESAQLFALGLDGGQLGDDPGRAAYLLGVAEAHIISLVAIIRAMTS